MMTELHRHARRRRMRLPLPAPTSSRRKIAVVFTERQLRALVGETTIMVGSYFDVGDRRSARALQKLLEKMRRSLDASQQEPSS